MLSSMTGFVSKTISLPVDKQQVVNVTINLKTLNSRFFEATCRLSYALNVLETEFIKLAKNKLHRGHMYLNISISDPNYFKSEVIASLSTIKNYLDALQLAKKQFKLPGNIIINDLLRIPNIFVAEETLVDEKIKNLILAGFEEAVTELKKIRSTEGNELLKDLKKRTKIMTKQIDEVKKLFKISFKKKQDLVNSELAKLHKIDSELAKQRRLQLYQELDRSDIHEEIVRFKTHLKSFETLLNKKQEEKGRQLDFTLQELGREINTIAAKSDDSTTSSHAITIKVELEKCREQIQNIV